MKELIEKYLEPLKSDENHRFKSWEHCYKAFNNEFESEDFLALHLAFYLASWGMYRGSGGLLWKDYKIHIGAVNIIKKYHNLRGVFTGDLPKIQEILNVFRELFQYYSKIEFKNGYNESSYITPTDTLISKIILGTLGCLPAFDRYFNIGAFSKEYSRINLKSLEKIWLKVEEKKSQIVLVQQWIFEEYQVWYPPMKIIDMYYWQKGVEEKINTIQQ